MGTQCRMRGGRRFSAYCSGWARTGSGDEAEGAQLGGLAAGERSFTACSVWCMECLARAGELEKAQLLFGKLLGYANHLGVCWEQIGPSGQHLGKFPQAFTHLGLIS